MALVFLLSVFTIVTSSIDLTILSQVQAQSLTFYQDELLCFANPYDGVLNYDNCCLGKHKYVEYNDCFPPGSKTLTFDKCCWDTPEYTASVDCETAELSYKN